MTQVLVAVPAHDEEGEVGVCLTAVRAAAVHALAVGTCSRVTVAVAVNRSTDATRAECERALSSWPDHLVVEDDTSTTVGAVRRDLVARASSGLPPSAWIFSTDADSRVPVDWITSTLQQVERTGAAAAAGLVALRDWSVSVEVQDAYAAVLAGGMDGATHTHVYGANLAVRLDAYARAGGFRAVHAEDQDLVDRLRLAGEPVTTLLAPVVLTSAREPGRADEGLGALLLRLRRAHEETGRVV